MNTLQRKIHTMLHTPRIFMKKFESSPIFPLLSDKTALKIQYKNVFLRDLDLENPQTFNEKIQWLKLYNRNPQYTQMVDKYAAKAFVADKIGAEYIIPTLGVWDSFEDIDFDALPNQFVLKCTHGSGDVVVCTDKEKLDKEAAREKLSRALHTDFYKIGREWPYKNVPRKILAEQYMTDNGASGQADTGLTDYKFYCFNGVANCVMVCRDRHLHNTKFYFFDRNWTFCRYNRLGRSLPEGFTMVKPEQMDRMFELADTLSKDLPFVRVDLYECGGRIYFGELTFFPSSGFEDGFDLKSDTYLGSLITLPEKTV